MYDNNKKTPVDKFFVPGFGAEIGAFLETKANGGVVQIFATPGTGHWKRENSVYKGKSNFEFYFDH